MRRSSAQAFSLLEIILVLFVLGVLAAAMVPSVADVLEKSRREAEAQSLTTLADAITESFQSADLANINVAALPGTVGTGETPTQFSISTAGYATTANESWFAKVARLRGLTPMVGTAPDAATQPELARIAFNAIGNPRWLFAAPAEAGQQRFLLVSLMARPEQLALPDYDTSAAWFDAIWQTTWESKTGRLPAYWESRLSAAQVAAWHAGSGGTTQTSRLSVRRIVLPKYRVTVNNNHLTANGYLSFNNTSNALTAPANSGATVTSEILGGRLIIINRGTAWPGNEVLRFHLRENATVTLQ